MTPCARCASLSAQPTVTERRQRRGRSQLRVLPLAAALLCSGALVGVGVGVVSKRIERRSEPIAATTATSADHAVSATASPSSSSVPATPPVQPAPTFIQPVADVERTLALMR